MSLRSRVSSIFGASDGSSNASDRDDSDSGVVKGEYTWEDYLREHSPGEFRGSENNTVPDYNDLPEKHQHDVISPDSITDALGNAGAIAEELSTTVDEVTVNVEYEDEDEFFTTSTGETTVVTRYDLEKDLDNEKKTHFVEIDRYWVNKPYAFVIIFRSTKENEVKYFAIEPHLNIEEERILTFLHNKLQDTIKYSEEATRGERTNAERAAHIEEEAYKLLFRYDLIDGTPFEIDGGEDPSEAFKQELGLGRKEMFDETVTDADFDVVESEDDDPGRLRSLFSRDTETDTADSDSSPGRIRGLFQREKEQTSIVDKLIAEEAETGNDEAIPEYVYTQPEDLPSLEGHAARPEDAVINEGLVKLTDYQVMKLMYYLKRNAVSFGKIDPIKHDINVEDISCDGYNMRVWVYHGDYEQIISNIYHGKKELDDFVINLAQRSGQGISKRTPQVDVTLPDGSRGQLTLGAEVSDHGTNYTIRQFKEIPFTPIDLINWKTFAPEQMSFLWLCIENHKSLIFAGGTASGKTTSLNAISLFIPSNTKIVSIEDTREVELPQRNWVASVTRPSFTEDGAGEVDEFALLEAALRQRPDYIVMGEIRGEEGRTLFQVMSTGHTTYTTFHADSVGEVIKRFTTDPINVSKTLFTALDLVSIQTATRVDGQKVRRNKVLTEVNDYSSETDEINVNDVFQWVAENDEFEKTEDSEVLNTIMFDRGWDEQQLDEALRKRNVVIAYLIVERLNTYTQVAATIQAFINGPEIVLDLIANDVLEESLENLQEMESVVIDIDPDKEEMVPRPEPPEDILEWAKEVLADEMDGVLADRDGIDPDGKLAGLLDRATATNADNARSNVDEAQAQALLKTLQSGTETTDDTGERRDDTGEGDGAGDPTGESATPEEEQPDRAGDFSGFVAEPGEPDKTDETTEPDSEGFVEDDLAAWSEDGDSGNEGDGTTESLSGFVAADPEPNSERDSTGKELPSGEDSTAGDSDGE